MKNIFIVIIAIAACCAVIAGLIFNMQLKQEKAELILLKERIEQVDKEIATTKEKLNILEQQNKDLEEKILEFKNKITSYNTQTDELKNKKEQLFNNLQTKRAELISLNEKLEDLSREKDQLTTRLNEISSKNKSTNDELVKCSETKRQFEEDIKKYIKPQEGVELDRIVVKLSQIPSGVISEVNNKYGFAIIDIGSDNGVIVGDILGVYRNDELVSKVIVEKVYKEMSSAVPAEGFTDVELKVSDAVRLIK